MNSRFAAERAPQKSWGAVWVGALVLFFVVAVTMELKYRQLGHRGEIKDTKSRWSYVRWQADRADNPIILLGDSRMQLGFATNVFREQRPDQEVFQLGLAGGKSPLPVIHHLADDEDFRGTVICALIAKLVEPDEQSIQAGYVQYYEKAFSYSRAMDELLWTPFQTRLAILHPQLSSESVAASVAGGSWPKPNYYRTSPDRTRVADFAKFERLPKKIKDHSKELRRWMAEKPRPDLQAWRSEAARLKPAIEKLKSRGVRVVFVRFPSTGLQWEYEEAFYPKQQCWDTLGELTGAETLHFKDYSDLDAFDCPDFSHFDGADAESYTLALMKHLEL